MAPLWEFLESFGQEVDDFEEETFLLFSQEIPSQNLGFIDSRSNSVDVVIHGQDISIRQSPSVLTSTRAGGTTGAVLWKITPLIAEWLSSNETNPLWTSSILSSTSTIVELGCGIAGLIPICLSRSIGHYIATDQEYVQRLLNENISSNAGVMTTQTSHQQKHGGSSRPRQSRKSRAATQAHNPRPSSSSSNSTSRTRKPLKETSSQGNKTRNITFLPLDWEQDDPSTLQSFLPAANNSDDDEDTKPQGFDILLACDCIYNNALITPFLRTCADICRLRGSTTSSSSSSNSTHSHSPPTPTVCIIAQQLRSPEVFEPWLREAMSQFRVWRVKDEHLVEGLRGGKGYVVHVLVLKE